MFSCEPNKIGDQGFALSSTPALRRIHPVLSHALNVLGLIVQGSLGEESFDSTNLGREIPMRSES
jgi:hypothetical protein